MRSTEQIILFGKYRILRQLGEGASSQVYLAEHVKLKTYRAVKRISKAHPLQSQFRLEANLLKNLSHSSIPIVYDIEEDEFYFYMIEEYVEGESLQEYLLYHDTISQDYIMQLGIRLCEFFIYLHSRKPHPLCYKDLKPEHIIVCGNFVKIVDFGIASYITSGGKKFHEKNETDKKPEKSFSRLGTVGYAAPEQYTGESVTPAADLYALGKVLLQLERKAESSSKNLKRIIQKASAEEIGRRYASAEELKRALEQEKRKICPLKSGNTHLCYHIAAAGAKSGVGTTHIALAVTAYLNWMGYSCIYQSQNEVDVVELFIRGHYVSEGQEGIYEKRNFKGRLKRNAGKEQETDKAKEAGKDSYVADFGNCLEDCLAEEADYTILVIGGSIWEEEISLKALGRFGNVRNLIVVCNHAHKGICRKYADLCRQKIYCFPIDENPWKMTRKKQKLFAKMLQKDQPPGRSDIRRKRERRSAIFSGLRGRWSKEQ